MSMSAYVEIWLGQRSYDGIAKACGLPETVSVGDSCYLTAKAVKACDEWLEVTYSALQQGETINLQTVHAIKVCEFVVAHGKNYINQASMEADSLQLQGKQRLDFMRAKTHEYKLWFA
jgi:hypothetical protein